MFLTTTDRRGLFLKYDVLDVEVDLFLALGGNGLQAESFERFQFPLGIVHFSVLQVNIFWRKNTLLCEQNRLIYSTLLPSLGQLQLSSITLLLAGKWFGPKSEKLNARD